MTGEYLRKKARSLELLASICFDADVATRLRVLADEFQNVADRHDDADQLEPFIFPTGGRESGGVDRH